MKKTIAFLSFLLAVCMLAACGPADPGSSGTTPVPDTTEALPVTSSIPLSALGSYMVVRPDVASDEIVDAAVTLRSELAKLAPDIGIKTDFYKAGIQLFEIGEYEILVGAVNRPESKEFRETLRRDDYGYRIVGSKLVICGGDDEATLAAIRRFTREVIRSITEESEIFYSSEMDSLSLGKYSINTLLLGTVPANEFRIVYPKRGSKAEADIAGLISGRIYEATGYLLETVDDSVPRDGFPHEILIGETDRDPGSSAGTESGKAAVRFDGTDIKICGADSQGIGVAARKLTDPLDIVMQDTYTLEIPSEMIFEYDTSGQTAMSFNVLVSNATAERKERVIKIVRNYMPDTVGFQEVSPDWMTTLTKGLGDIYGYVGQGRDGGSKGEHNPIFYKKEVFNLIDSGTKWLSDTPSAVSKYSESSLNRIWTYALLERKSDGTRIMVVNTHFDHKSSDARVKQSLVLASFLKDYLTYPMIVTGDFNAKSGTTEYSNIIKAGLKDSSYVAPASERVATFTNYGSSNSIIDFIFINPKTVEAKSYRVCNEMINNNFPSDHHPVYVEYSIFG